MKKAMCALFLALALTSANAGTYINTNGSSDGIAISGFDVVAFHTEKKAVPGVKEHSYTWKGATWLFASKENLELFKSNPEKYEPQYGGHCALSMADGKVSSKPANGQFEIEDGKLYLFPNSRDGSQSGVKNYWLRSSGQNILWGDRNWPKVKEQLEAK